MKLDRTVIVTHPETGQRIPMLAGREVPAWAVPLLDEPQDDYDGTTVDALKSEIRKRNKDRDDADRLSAEGRKADLIKTLRADDRR